jgi:hypothetical protein
MDDTVNKEAVEKKRPVVIIILAIVLLLNGIMTIIEGLNFAANPIVLGLGGVALLLSLGLWMLWAWAWVGTMLLQIGAIGFAFYDWFTGGPIDVLGMGLGDRHHFIFAQAGDPGALF